MGKAGEWLGPEPEKISGTANDDSHGQFPPQWADDYLTDYFTAAFQNRLATFANKPEAKRVVAIDHLFLRIVSGWQANEIDILPLFLFRCHASFRAASELCFAGSIPEAAAVARLCLEYAGYGALIASDSSLGEVWLRRDDDKRSSQKVRDVFTRKNIIDAIKKSDVKDAEVYERLLEQGISFGAHPLPGSVLGSLSVVEAEDGRTHHLTSYLSGDGLMLDHSLKYVSQVGVNSLYIFERLFEPRFSLIGVRQELLSLRKGL